MGDRRPGQGTTFRAPTSGNRIGQAAGRPQEASEDSRFLGIGEPPQGLQLGLYFRTCKGLPCFMQSVFQRDSSVQLL